MSKETVLITGASSGIGKEMARLFALEGSQVILVARNKAALDELAVELFADYGTRARVMKADLSKPATPKKIFDTLSDEGVQVDVVVNNAGFGQRGAVADTDPQRNVDMVQVNVTALTALTNLFLPGMIERGRGGILNVASTAAFQSGPFMAVYYATKAYVVSFTDALYEEVKGTGVHVSCLCPGPTQTGFVEEAGMQDTKLFKHANFVSARDVAQEGITGLRNNNAVVVTGLGNKVGAFGARFMPRSLSRRIIRIIQG